MTDSPVCIGIDTNSFGFHVVSNSRILMPGADDALNDPLVRLGWSLSTGDAQVRRLLAYRVAVQFFSSIPEGAVVGIEEPLILPKNIDTTMKLVMMGGVLEAAFWQANPDATLHWVNVSTWRRKVINPPKGAVPRAKRSEWWKQQAREHTLAVGNYTDEEIGTMEMQPDLYDAACVMRYVRDHAAA